LDFESSASSSSATSAEGIRRNGIRTVAGRSSRRHNGAPQRAGRLGVSARPLLKVPLRRVLATGSVERNSRANEEAQLRRRNLLSVLVLVLSALALLAAGCGGDDNGTSGSSGGDFTVSYESFDDSTAAKGAWDEATCAANARKYVEDESILGVIGTFNSGCAKIEVPIANEASLAYVSPANTAVGLTHVGPGSEPGEPDKYYPSGTRNYARVVASDDFQGEIDAAYMQDALGVTSVYILDDKDAYGKGVAD